MSHLLKHCFYLFLLLFISNCSTIQPIRPSVIQPAPVQTEVQAPSDISLIPADADVLYPERDTFNFQLNPTEINAKLDIDVLEAELSWWWQTPYRYGGVKLSGIDCSALTERVYRGLGYDLPRTTDAQKDIGLKVNKNKLLIGDLVFFSSNTTDVSHVGIYAGNGYFVHASQTAGVTLSRFWHEYYQKRFRFARRVVW